ncbi:MAG TPA: glycosyl hydrolase [Bacteroidales bacterium]|nr:glycosyl hydrolase [Bacteroidales bacterium]
MKNSIRIWKYLLPAVLVIIIIFLLGKMTGLKNSGPEGFNKKGTTVTDIRSPGLQSFDYTRFFHPESFYRPGYFWSWNDTMTKELLLEQMTDMKEHGVMTLCPMPIPSAFRPVNMPTRMIPDYLSPGYLELFQFITEKCNEFDMVPYLYDEGGWPSGSCLGRVVEQNPSLVRQSLTRKILEPSRGDTVVIPADCISAFMYRGNTRLSRIDPGTTLIVEEDSANVSIFTVSRSGTYPDLLNPRSTSEFIRLTHEEYKKHIGQYFGSTYRIAFTDEPKVANPGWTDDLASSFSIKFGYDIRNELPSLFGGAGINDMKVRIDFFNWWSQRFADAYLGQIQEWCHENNLMSGGHLDGEDATINARTAGYGHPLRALRKMDVPAVDVIWRQLWPGKQNHHFPKFASTVAHQSGLPWAFTESFAVYGNGLTASQMKWISDYQYVRGINLLVIGGYPLSKKDWLQAGCRPNCGPGDPVWKYMDIYHDYVGRLSYLLSLGEPGIRTALYYPVNDIWAGGPDVKTICSSNDDLARILLENQCDFDLIDDDILANEAVKIKNGKLKIGPMEYNSIFISRNEFMPAGSAEKIEKFIRTGGKVIWVDNDKSKGTLPGAIFTTTEDLSQHIEPVVHLTDPDRHIRVCKRIMDRASLYFVTNEDTCHKKITIVFSEDMRPVRLDPETGLCHVPAHAVRKQHGWEIPLEMEFAGSAVFIFTNEVLPVSEEPVAGESVLQTITEGWTCGKTSEYTIGSHSTTIDNNPSETKIPAKPGDWRTILGESFSGDALYEVSFSCSEQEIKRASLLDLGEVKYFCRAELNGQDLGRRIWKPFAFDIRGKLKEGNNVLRITVTNTLANQYVTTKALDVWTKNQLGPYHSRTLAFEKESLPSGLYGPVTLR